MKAEREPSASNAEERPTGKEDAESRGEKHAHGPPEDAPELTELDMLWEHLVTTLPALPNR